MTAPHPPEVTVLVCRDLGTGDGTADGTADGIAALAAAVHRHAPGTRVFAVDDLCGRPRRLRAAAADLRPGRTVVACRDVRRRRADIRRALDRAGVPPEHLVFAELDTAVARTADETAQALCAAVDRASLLGSPAGAAAPRRCRRCGAPLGGAMAAGGSGPRAAAGPIDIAAVAARLAQSHPAIADRLLHADRCADCLLAEGSA